MGPSPARDILLVSRYALQGFVNNSGFGYCALMSIASVLVYCSSSAAAPDSFKRLAFETGAAIAGRGWRLVYGGADIGLMGEVARGALEAGGMVTGVMTGHLNGFEIAHHGLSELYTTGSMHERKAKMTDLSDAVLVLPGGFGTLDETMEAITWKQLDIHDKPIVLLDHEGFWEPLMVFLRHAADLRLIRSKHLDLFAVAQAIPEALDLIAAPAFREKDTDKWWRETHPNP